MPLKFSSRLLILLILMSSMPAGAAGLDDADERLFKVQLAMAEKGDVRAQYYLGEMHEQGLGTRQDLDEAFKWYEKAAEKGDAWAKRKLVHRTKIEADAKKDQATEDLKTAPVPEKRKTPGNTAKNNRAAPTPAMIAKTDESAEAAERIKAMEREKRRAAVRAMILERIRHPVGELFE